MNAQLQNNRPANPVASFNAFMQKHKSQLELALPKHLNADRMVRLSLTAFSQNPALQRCDPKTIFGSIIVASQLGLEIGVNGQGYLVPYKTNCTFVPGWKGLVDLANRGGRCTVWTGAVYEGDEFDYMLGDSPYCKHKPCGEFEESKLTHVYAIGRVKDSEMPVIEVWPIKKVHAHFKKTVVPALQPNHYSKKHLEAYAKKVALLQVLKYMPQSIEMSNAVDVSYAAESGKGVTIDGDFITVDQSQNDEQETNDQNSTQNDAPSFEQEQQVAQQVQEVEVDYAPTFAQIKHGILTAKSPAHLDVMEDQAMDHANKDERKQLMTLIKAQSAKFQPAAEVQESKKPEPAADEVPPVQEVAEKKQTSTEVRKAMLEQISGMKNAKDLKTIIPFIQGHEILTAAHKTYLINTIEHEIGELTKPAEQPATQAPAVNEIKSKSTANGLKISIESAQTVEALTDIAQTIRDSKPNMTIDHLNDVLNTYQLRKKFLEDQQDMFAGVPDLTWTDSAIKQIESAKNQDDINAVYTDPQFEEQSDKDKQRLNLAAQKRESELFG
ncbi:recombinase RecT [Acinetobacter sp. WCHAc060007]|uniref:recombinase RecT n=1 Tax=Acinetobacter sp. WCHAc060007 TaxID=2419605 RepID=UPI000EA2AE2C|nr:recombinase RecT [Acinetobacter sp. WCHAc060007]RKG44884.1 hypothetical protein D7V31_01445 [Acinetobacter sp. WCHAc060007]